MTPPPRVSWRDIFYTSFDGLQLYGRLYPARPGPAAGARPVLCLAGLTRDSRDFHHLAEDLSTHPERPRDVYCLDYRGRGFSEHDPNWRNYTPLVELRDILDFLTIEGQEALAVVGTSRGGILAMILAAARPTSLGAVVLNDIGPEIDAQGITRIMGYVGKMPAPTNWEAAAEALKRMNETFFPALSDDDWRELARQTFRDEGGRPVASYDPNIAKTFAEYDPAKGLPNLWPQFLALKDVPVLVLRGENSDLLSAATAKRMAAVHPDCQLVTVPGQGHAPILKFPETLGAIRDFLARTDGPRSHPSEKKRYSASALPLVSEDGVP